MKIEQQLLVPEHGCNRLAPGRSGPAAQLVLVFGSQGALAHGEPLAQLRAAYPQAWIVCASGAAEFTSTGAGVGQLAVTAVAFDSTRVAAAALTVSRVGASRTAGAALAGQLCGPELRHVLMFFDGQRIDGAQLSRGLNEHLPRGVTVSGGPAGSGNPFENVLLGLNEPPGSGRAIAVAFFGRRLQVGIGSAAGWAPRGDECTVTGAEGRVLLELDGAPAFDVYQSHLTGRAGDVALSCRAARPPSSDSRADAPAAPTIVAVDPSGRSLLFNAQVRRGTRVQFMDIGFEDLLVSAAQAAKSARLEPAAELALCLGGAGRPLVLGDRHHEEPRWIRRFLGPHTALAGLYSHSELAGDDRLSNQTMAITTLRET
jgi:hypothetical protein